MSQSIDNHERFENLRLELRRGCLSLAVLSQLKTERYGYTLRKALNEQGMEIDEGTALSPASPAREPWTSDQRMEGGRETQQALLSALSSEGKQVLKQLAAEWQSINKSLNGIL